MIVLLLILAGVGVLAMILGLLSKSKPGEPDVVQSDVASCATCSGYDENCMHDCMIQAAVNPIEYYDDEELDRFQGRESDTYSEEEVEQFAEVFYTLQPQDVPGWSRSLILRGINLPDALKDEVILMLQEN